ncbi:rRNA maturation RNase YbeY [Blattabacterium cuenoti]|uniref:rRNA maturation RNase YbeY n=1 Tax=Blattabacterium cuenoti TaxID=1653831 RepID=UPI00374CE944
MKKAEHSKCFDCKKVKEIHPKNKLNKVKTFGIVFIIFFIENQYLNHYFIIIINLIMINFFYEISNFSIQNESFFSKKICMILKNEGRYAGNINYVFCDDHFILNMNKKYLNKNYYTDVIAFNNSNTRMHDNIKKNMTKTSPTEISGDIFISIDRILSNSKQWNQFFQVELKRVMIHAILHFLGYDDQDKIKKKLMKKKEEFYLNLFQF